MALGKEELKLAKALYWIILSAVHLYICYLLFMSDRAIAGILWLVFGFMLIYIMYPVYFPNGGAGTRWPPYVTTCPDYLTLIAPNACADFVGLGSPILQKSDPALPPSPSDSSRVFDASGTVAQKAARAQQYGLSWEGIL
jgi:hypothetical protein